MNRFVPRVLIVAVAATFALAGCGRDDNRSSSTNRPGSTAGTTGGTASSPNTPGSTPSPSGGGSAMSGGGAAPSGSTGASANGGVSSPSGTTAGSSSSSGDMTTASPSASDSGTANTGTRGSGTPGGDTATGGTGSAAGTTGATGTTGTSSSGTGTTGSSGEATPSSTPGKSSSLDSHIVGAHVQLAADTSTAPTGAKLSHADKEFIEDAASGGLTEVEVGKMMSERAKHPEVKRFAEMLVQDHTQANEELRRIAASSGVSLPATPETKHRVMIERLANEKGGDIDRTFIKNFGVKEHEQDIKQFQKQAEKGDNPQLKAFAAKTLPKLQEHLAMARKLESELAK